jgi:hypothetical protein
MTLVPSRKDRWIGFFELTLRGKGHPNKPLPMPTAAFRAIHKAAEDAKERGERLIKEIILDRLLICLDEISVDEARDVVILLFTVLDADAADAAYRNLGTLQQRTIKKAVDEGGAISAHLVIDLRAKPNSDRYSVALERIEGVSRTRILPFLEHLLLTLVGKVDVPVDDGMIQVDPVLEMDAMPSASLQQSLSQGVLKGIELVQIRRRGRLDEGQAFDEAQRAIIFRIPPKTTGNLAQQVLRGISRSSEYSEYPEIRVRWERPDGREQSITAVRDEAELLSQAFARIEKVEEFGQDLEAASVEIRHDLAEKMLALLRQ